MFCGSVKVWFFECLLAEAESSKKAFVSGQSGVKMGSMLGELPPLGFELEMVGDEGPVECGHPVGNVVMFLDPGLIIGVMGCELDGGVVVDVVVRVPIS